jgi:hypothetical protein
MTEVDAFAWIRKANEISEAIGQVLGDAEDGDPAPPEPAVPDPDLDD